MNARPTGDSSMASGGAGAGGDLFSVVVGDSPLVATAIHDGSGLREDIRRRLALSDQQRLREEDPFTALWTHVAPTRIAAGRSRFEVDFNRPREKAVYRVPADAWGLTVWNDALPEHVAAVSLEAYDTFYAVLHTVLTRLVRRHGRVVVLDLHTYNHRREGPDCRPADPEAHPGVNIGTGTMDRSKWAPLVDRFIDDLGAFDFPGGRLDVRENVCFRGGNMSRWIHQTFPDSICSISVEFKKFFMDEWTGTPDVRLVEAIGEALASTRPGLLASLAEPAR